MNLTVLTIAVNDYSFQINLKIKKSVRIRDQACYQYKQILQILNIWNVVKAHTLKFQNSQMHSLGKLAHITIKE